MLLLVDNYDSFTFNLYQQLRFLGADVLVVRNDEITVQELSSLDLSGIVISPGPGRPDEAGISTACVDYAFKSGLPLLGVCLGHQVIGEYFGARVIRADRPVHGEADLIYHNQTGVFNGVKNPFSAARYHSLVVDVEAATGLVVTARNKDGVIMGVQHISAPVYGLQFHPESFLTEEGDRIIKNFLREVKDNARSSAGDQEAIGS